MTHAVQPDNAEAHFSYALARSDDAHDHACSLQHWKQRYEQLSRGRFTGEVEEVWFGNVQIFRESTNQIVHEAGVAWEGSRTFGIPLEAEGEGWYCGEIFDRNSMLTLKGDDELDFRTPRKLNILAVTADMQVFGDYARRVEGRDIEAEIGRKRVICSVPEKAEELRSFLLTALNTVKAAPHLLEHAAMRKALEQAIFCSLLGNR
jgi:AraC family ethanolamine operon transcriptional activator